MLLHLVRHLAPQAASGLCYGRTDLAACDTLETAALPALQAALPAGVPLISSPLRRCASLAVRLQREVQFDARLVELDFGAWEMQSWDAIARAEIDAWAADVTHYRPGGGESVFDMACRIDDFYSGLQRAGAAEAVIICHAGAIRLLAARARGLAPEAMAREAALRPHAIGYGEIVRIQSV